MYLFIYIYYQWEILQPQSGETVQTGSMLNMINALICFGELFVCPVVICGVNMALLYSLFYSLFSLILPEELFGMLVFMLI